MKIIFLGTNGWYDTKTGNTVCILIETKKEYVVLDAGNGFYKIDKYIKSKKPIYLFLSHFHLEHLIGFHTLAKFNFRQGIQIYGPRGIKRVFANIINKPYTVPLTQLKMKVKVSELKKKCKLPVKCEFTKLLHSSFCYGYRFLLENKIITFCTDTGVCRNLYRLAKNADLLIAECSYETGKDNTEWPHLNPQQAAAVAKEAQAKRLALVHFDANIYRSFQKRKEAQKIAKNIFRNVVSAVDGMQLRV